jgi:hypothetical protein
MKYDDAIPINILKTKCFRDDIIRTYKMQNT